MVSPLVNSISLCHPNFSESIYHAGNTHTYTHTYIYIYIYIYIYMRQDIRLSKYAWRHTHTHTHTPDYSYDKFIFIQTAIKYKWINFFFQMLHVLRPYHVNIPRAFFCKCQINSKITLYNRHLIRHLVHISTRILCKTHGSYSLHNSVIL